MMTRRMLSLLVLVLFALLALGCGGDDEKSESSDKPAKTASKDEEQSDEEKLTEDLEDADVEIIDDENPEEPDPDDVWNELTQEQDVAFTGDLLDEGEDVEEYARGAVEDAPDEDDGLVAAITNALGTAIFNSNGHVLVYVFESPEEAAEYAAEDEEIFGEEDAEDERVSYISGSVVGYYSPAGAESGEDSTDDFEEFMKALEDLD